MDEIPKKTKMITISKRIEALRKKFKKLKIDGYIIPKNDEFFTESSNNNILRYISNFSGSAGLAIVLKKKNYLFVDGRYTVQSKNESGENFKIIEIHKKLPKDILKNECLGIDSRLFTSAQIRDYFGKKIQIKEVNKDIFKINQKKENKNNLFFSISSKITGQKHKYKINLIRKYLRKNEIDYLLITAPENIAWILNIRGFDTPYSPLPNCNLIIGKNKFLKLIVEKSKIKNLINEGKITYNEYLDPTKFEKLINTLHGRSFNIDFKTCSIFKQNIISKKFKIKNIHDPCYYLKSIKNKKELFFMKRAHLEDGLALTKFLYWIKNQSNRKMSELSVQKKLENFRKKNKNYLYPSFNTISGSGPNSAIIHYNASKKTNREIKKKDIYLCDSGGQYHYGTTDVTRTICFNNQPSNIKNIFTKVLKGHIAVTTSDLEKFSTGKQLDVNARKYLKKSNLDYAHGTGHGVGFFLNVHEGPQAISKFNKIKLREGMILSNEPGYYKEGKFGIRIENLVYVTKKNKKLKFQNLTLAPIDKELVNFKHLNKKEIEYWKKYHLLVYSKLSKYLSKKEKTWLSSHLTF